MTEYFERYAAAVDALDPDAIAGFFQLPCLMVNDDHVAALTTDHALRSNMKSICEYHQRAHGER